MNVVSVMAHQDDELMCLGTMLKMKQRGDSIHFICLTRGETGMVHHPEMDVEEAAECRRREMTAMVQAAGGTYQCLDFEDEFLFDTRETRCALIEALRKVKADVIFTHNETDYNLDHMTVNRLVRQCGMQMAFPMLKTASPPTQGFPAVFQVEPASGCEFQPSHWVDISDVIDEKIRLAAFHKSQDEAFRAGFGENYGIGAWMCGISGHRGEECGTAQAEAFRPMYSRGFIKGYAILP